MESIKILQKLKFKLFASIGTADFYGDHGIKVEAVEWPMGENENNNNGNGSKGPAYYQNITDYLSQKMICLVINLPLRQHRTTPAITKGYLTRRMAVEYSVPLVTDVKCAKLLIKVNLSFNTKATIIGEYKF